jgi:hypothetical protein
LAKIYTRCLAADPNYAQTIAASAQNKAMAKAWLDGRWDVVAGGMFDDVWNNDRNAIGRFDPPRTWRIDRAFDWGSSAPYSVGWYAESDGSDLLMRDGSVMSTVRGDVFRIGELYGWSGKPNEGLRELAVEVAVKVVEIEIARGWRSPGGHQSRVHPGPADSAIYSTENGKSIGADMEKPVRIGSMIYGGVFWTRADKRPGSRVSGWELMRTMIKAATPEPGTIREKPGLFIVEDENPQFLRTVLALPRCKKNLDDVDTDAEDHIADEVRYRVRASGTHGYQGTTSGMF